MKQPAILLGFAMVALAAVPAAPAAPVVADTEDVRTLTPSDAPHPLRMSFGRLEPDEYAVELTIRFFWDDLTISLAENVISSAERRALIHGAPRAVVRVSDLYSAIAAISGKIELVYDGEREGLEAISRQLVGRALKKVFDSHLPDAYATGGDDTGGPYGKIISWFGGGERIDIEFDLTSMETPTCSLPRQNMFAMSLAARPTAGFIGTRIRIEEALFRPPAKSRASLKELVRWSSRM